MPKRKQIKPDQEIANLNIEISYLKRQAEKLQREYESQVTRAKFEVKQGEKVRIEQGHLSYARAIRHARKQAAAISMHAQYGAASTVSAVAVLVANLIVGQLDAMQGYDPDLPRPEQHAVNAYGVTSDDNEV